jgi:ABC-2 type transport system permease protein/lipopolysaccharide transport system permease protein
MLAWQEIKHRYRRSMLGPLWLTISTGIMLVAMGPLYGRILHQDLGEYFAYLSISFVTWMLVANLITDSCQTFITAEGYIKDTKLPLTTHALRCVWRNLLIFGHNLLIVLLILLFYRPGNPALYPLFVVGIVLVAFNGLWLGILLGLLCTRFRDVSQLVASIVQIGFFLTPVLWKAEMLGERRWIAEVNPLYHALEVVRAPLLGRAPEALSWAAVLATTVIGSMVTVSLFSRYRARIAYWV